MGPRGQQIPFTRSLAAGLSFAALREYQATEDGCIEPAGAVQALVRQTYRNDAQEPAS